jgi:hypothetical protein
MYSNSVFIYRYCGHLYPHHLAGSDPHNAHGSGTNIYRLYRYTILGINTTRHCDISNYYYYLGSDM